MDDLFNFSGFTGFKLSEEELTSRQEQRREGHSWQFQQEEIRALWWRHLMFAESGASRGYLRTSLQPAVNGERLFFVLLRTFALPALRAVSEGPVWLPTFPPFPYIRSGKVWAEILGKGSRPIMCSRLCLRIDLSIPSLTHLRVTLSSSRAHVLGWSGDRGSCPSLRRLPWAESSNLQKSPGMKNWGLSTLF